MRLSLAVVGRLALFAVACLCCLGGDQSLEIDQMGGGKLASSAQNGPNVLFSMMVMPSTKLYSFSFNTATFVRVQDGRIPPYLTTILPYLDGFALFRNSVSDTSPVLFLVDGVGGFRESVRLADFEGYSASMSIINLASHKGGVIATIKNGIDTTELVLAEVDISARTVQPIGSYTPKNELISPFWASDGDQLYFFAPYLRYLAKAEPLTFHPKEILLPELEKVPAKSGPSPNRGGPSFLNFKPLIVDIGLAGGRLRFAEQIFTDETEEVVFMGRRMKIPVIEKKHYHLEAGKMISSDGLILGSFKGQQLIFQGKEETFQLR